MRRRIRSGPESRLPVALALALLAMAAWAAWLGWDQHRDVQPDGSETGPYEAWQVLGLALTLLAPLCWAAYRGFATGAVAGVTVGLTAAAAYDWSDDASGLFAVGVAMVMVGSLAVTAGVCALIGAVRPKEPTGRRHG
ncbi:hypothetical protein [Streptomyces sp. NPDC001502]|uniref:hypothetical protein n=1 Tax=Streptomyces sp. NPDC001502 TaxID=3364578 RepID=UPI0036926621